MSGNRPVSLVSTSVTSSSAVLSWAPLNGAVAYSVWVNQDSVGRVKSIVLRRGAKLRGYDVRLNGGRIILDSGATLTGLQSLDIASAEVFLGRDAALTSDRTMNGTNSRVTLGPVPQNDMF